MNKNTPNLQLQVVTQPTVSTKASTPIPVICRKLNDLISKFESIASETQQKVTEWENSFNTRADDGEDLGLIGSQEKHEEEPIAEETHKTCTRTMQSISHRAELQSSIGLEMHAAVQQILDTLSTVLNVDDVYNQMVEWKRKAEKNSQDNRDAHALLDKQQSQHNKKIALMQERHIRFTENQQQEMALLKSENRRLDRSLVNSQEVLKTTRAKLEDLLRSNKEKGLELSSTLSQYRENRVENEKQNRQIEFLERSLESSRRKANEAIERVKDLEQEKQAREESLSNHIDGLTENLQTRAHELSLIQSKAESQLVQIHSLENELKDSQSLVSRANKHAEHLEYKLRQSRETFQKQILEARNSRASALEEALQRKLEDNERLTQSLESEKSQLQGSLTSSQNELVQLQAKCESFASVLQDRTSSIDVLQAEMEDLKQRRDHWKENSKQYKSDAEKLEMKLSQELYPKITKLENSLIVSKKELKVANASREQTKEVLRSTEAELSSLEAKCNELSQKNRQLIHLQDSKTARQKELEKDNWDWEQRFKAQHQQHIKLIEVNERLSKQAEDDKEMVTKLRVELSSCQQLQQDLTQAKEQLSRQLKRKDQELGQAASQIEDLLQCTMSLKEDLTNTHEMHERSERTITSKAGAVKQLTAQLNELQVKNDVQHRELQKGQEEGVRRDQVNRTLREQLRKVERKLKLLQAVQAQQEHAKLSSRASAEQNALEARRQVGAKLELEQQLVGVQQKLDSKENECHYLNSALIESEGKTSQLESKLSVLTRQLENQKNIQSSTVRTVMDYSKSRNEMSELVEMRTVLGEMVQLVEFLKSKNRGLESLLKEQALTIHQLS